MWKMADRVKIAIVRSRQLNRRLFTKPDLIRAPTDEVQGGREGEPQVGFN